MPASGITSFAVSIALRGDYIEACVQEVAREQNCNFCTRVCASCPIVLRTNIEHSALSIDRDRHGWITVRPVRRLRRNLYIATGA